ncbi:peptidoglycan DD-metalloendopeptidase family protein [Polyangium spumosum]|uniref:Peptidoglycan DD-metalloendopeptidase family protein n=1 Tax=Polyangium spumosum TaxID=889282 RepID=A0A6N7PZP0_9BACT|nr:peptidoglycan DD-metalloendopeptidase family protein [Polyangium spumosum]
MHPVADVPEPIIPVEERSRAPELDDLHDASPEPGGSVTDASRSRLVVPLRRREAEGPPAAPRGPLSGLGGSAGAPLSSGLEGPAARPLPPRAHAGVHLTPRMTAIFGSLFGLATVTSIIALLIQVVPPRNERALIAGAALSNQASTPENTDAAKAQPQKRKREPIPGPWRLSELAKDPSVQILSGTIDRQSFVAALASKDVPKAQTYRIMKAFEGTRKFDKCGRKDKFFVALDRATKKVRAFEFEVSPLEVYQAREDQTGLLVGTRLDMKVAEAEVTGAFYVGKDLVAAYQFGGLEDGIIDTIDDALGGRISSEAFEEGSTVRVIAVEETALGLFARYKKIVALEYRPADPAEKPIRVYAFHGQEARGYWDDRGKQPYSGGWRMPCPGAPVTSHFNPKRKHPVLKKVMPHNGTDFGAPMGTPVYSAYKGTVDWVGPAGPSGNLVTIMHPNGIQTGYAHLSRFAPSIKIGMKIGVHQLVGYVGSTGRSTGPHLHFSAKKDGKFFDALTLQMDGERVLPPMDRAAFLEAKAELDRRLDAIPLPEPPPEKPAPAPVAAPSPAASAAPAAEGAPEAPQAPQPAGDPAAIQPSGSVEATGDDDDEGGGIPIPAPLLKDLPMGPSSATPIAGPGKKAPSAPAPEAPPDDPDEDAEAH